MQVIENQGQHLPNTVALEKILVARFGFNKAKAAKTAKALRESLEWEWKKILKQQILHKRSAIPISISYISMGRTTFCVRLR